MNSCSLSVKNRARAVISMSPILTKPGQRQHAVQRWHW
jgi:hypothetical protein